jgi:UDP-2-acetamido-3-amino-2,3-dideoxy-glucuronate N-acetyltransferase
LRGRCALLLDDGILRAEIALNGPVMGVLVPPLGWGVQCRFSLDAMLLVLVSEPYDPSEYIRDYREFRSIVGGMGTSREAYRARPVARVTSGKPRKA